MISEKLKLAIEYRNKNNFDQAHKLFNEMIEEKPDDPLTNLHLAWLYDKQGKETQAIPHYNSALKGNLPKSDLQEAYLGLGSTYRALGMYEESKKILLEGIEKIPEYSALKTFLALTLYNLEEYHESISILVKQLVNTTSDDIIKQYSRALHLYAENLDQIYK